MLRSRLGHAVLRTRHEVRTTFSQLGLDRSYHKVFAIGANKTATTSIHALLEELGFASYHGKSWISPNATTIHRRWQAFSDGPPEDFKLLDATYPRSKFLLNTRDLDEWLDSRLEHIRWEEARGNVSESPLWQATEETVEAWIRRRNQNHLDIMQYFECRPDDLLVINFIRDPHAATKIARFLGKPPPQEKPYVRPIPKTRDIGHLKNTEMISEAFARLGIPAPEWKNDLYCPSLLEVPSGFPADTSEIGQDE